jgi:hypothetical protein
MRVVFPGVEIAQVGGRHGTSDGRSSAWERCAWAAGILFVIALVAESFWLSSTPTEATISVTSAMTNRIPAAQAYRSHTLERPSPPRCRLPTCAISTPGKTTRDVPLGLPYHRCEVFGDITEVAHAAGRGGHRSVSGRVPRRPRRDE